MSEINDRINRLAKASAVIDNPVRAAEEIKRLTLEHDQMAASFNRLQAEYIQTCRDGESLASAVDSLMSDFPDEGQAEAARSAWSDRADPVKYRAALAEVKAQAVEDAMAKFGPGLIWPSELADYAQSIRQAQEVSE